MSDVNGINGYSSLRAISAAMAKKTQSSPRANVQTAGSQDEVQISAAARYLSRIASMPEIRAEKVFAVRQALADGIYDIEGRLPAAIDRMFQEELG